jgi:hypothetical protein
MKMYLANWESYYYIIKGMKFKRLFLKYSFLTSRIKNFYKTLYALYNSCDDMIIDITNYNEDIDFEQKLLPLHNLNVSLASRTADLDIVYSDLPQDKLHIGRWNIRNSGSRIIPVGYLNVPFNYIHTYGILYGGASFHNSHTLLFMNNRIIKYNYIRVKHSKTENLIANLQEVQKYFNYMEE